MARAKQNIDDSERLINLYSQLEQNDPQAPIEGIKSQISSTIETMRKNGSWTIKDDPTVQDLQKIIQEQ
jgi:hypothetical protein